MRHVTHRAPAARRVRTVALLAAAISAGATGGKPTWAQQAGTSTTLIGTTTDPLTNDGLISASGDSYIRVLGNPLTNHGTIEAINGGRLFLEPRGASSNAGTIRATSGGSIEFIRNGTWTNTGTFHLSEATLMLAGAAVSPVMTAGLTRGENATVIVGGTVQNTGSTLALDAFAGPWALGRANSSIGEIRGGNIGSPGALGTLPVVGYSQLTNVTNNLHLDVHPGVIFTLAGNTTNGGSITANGAEVIVTGSPTSLGTMSLTDSTLQFGTTDPFFDAPTNAAVAQLSQVALTRSKFLIARHATIDNSGNAIHVTADRPWHFAGGTLKNGSVQIDPGAEFMPVDQISTLDNVAVAGPLILGKGMLRFQNGSTWTGDHITIRYATVPSPLTAGVLLDGNTTWDAPVEISLEGEAGGVMGGAVGTPTGDFTLASELTVRNKDSERRSISLFSQSGLLVNRGKITVEGGRVQLSGPAVTNEGLIEVRGSNSLLVVTRKPTNYVNRKLTGGRWHVYDGGGLFITDYSVITTNAAEILISGGPSRDLDDALWSLTANEGSLSILDGHVLNVGALTNTGHLKVGSGSVLTTNGMLDSTAGKMDVDGMVIVTATAETRASVLASVNEQIRTARNASKGRWTGDSGITSAAAAADPLTGLAAVINDDDGSGSPIIETKYGKVTPDANSVIVLHTYNGDANLDGRINADDYFRIDSGFLAQPADPTYADGDFNYDDKINADDYFLIDSAFLGQGEPLGVSAGLSSLASAAVPEPSLAGVLLLGGFLTRRRRGRHMR